MHTLASWRLIHEGFTKQYGVSTELKIVLQRSTRSSQTRFLWPAFHNFGHLTVNDQGIFQLRWVASNVSPVCLRYNISPLTPPCVHPPALPGRRRQRASDGGDHHPAGPR